MGFFEQLAVTAILAIIFGIAGFIGYRIEMKKYRNQTPDSEFEVEHVIPPSYIAPIQNGMMNSFFHEEPSVAVPITEPIVEEFSKEDFVALMEEIAEDIGKNYIVSLPTVEANVEYLIHPVVDMPILERRNVILAAIQGNGKTQSQIRMMVNDIERGAQVWWLSHHLALLNDEDQRTDLRPLKNHFKQVREYPEILRHLQAFAAEAERRLPLYWENVPVGDTIVLYIDELPGIAKVLGEDAIDALAFILREGRKCRVFVNVASQDALTKTLGMDSGIREQFNTRLCGRVDKTSWSALVGADFPRYKPKQRGEWTFAGSWDDPQVVQISPATKEQIERVAKLTPVPFMDIESVQMVPHGNNLEVVQQPTENTNVYRVVAWIIENERITNREIARRLWPESGKGGGRWGMDAGVIRAEAERIIGVMANESVPVLRVTEVEEDDDFDDEEGVPEPSSDIVTCNTGTGTAVTPLVTDGVTARYKIVTTDGTGA